MQSAAAGDESEYKAVEGLRHMMEQVDFIDDSILRCWKEACKADMDAETSRGGSARQQHRHVPASTIRTLLMRYAAAPPLHALLGESQLADITITRHWVRHVLWTIGFRHGYVDAANPDPEMRPDNAFDIARDAAPVCERVCTFLGGSKDHKLQQELLCLIRLTKVFFLNHNVIIIHRLKKEEQSPINSSNNLMGAELGLPKCLVT